MEVLKNLFWIYIFPLFTCCFFSIAVLCKEYGNCFSVTFIKSYVGVGRLECAVQKLLLFLSLINHFDQLKTCFSTGGTFGPKFLLCLCSQLISCIFPYMKIDVFIFNLFVQFACSA